MKERNYNNNNDRQADIFNNEIDFLFGQKNKKNGSFNNNNLRLID